MRATNHSHTPGRLGFVFLAGLLLSTGSALAQDPAPRFPGSAYQIGLPGSPYLPKIDEIVYLGAKHFYAIDLNEATGLKCGEPLMPWRNHLACLRILERYYEQGRPLATVSLVEGGKPTDRRVVFNITEGPKVKIQDVDCSGNTFVSTAVLKTHLKSSSESFGANSGKYNPSIADADVTTLEEYYRGHGFLDVKVTREMRWADDNYVNLVFQIKEGLRYRLAGKEITPETLKATPHVKAGDWYSDPKVDQDENGISDYISYPGRKETIAPSVSFPIVDPKGSPSWWCPILSTNK